MTDERTSADVDRLLDDVEALTLKALYELPDEQIEQALDSQSKPSSFRWPMPSATTTTAGEGRRLPAAIASRSSSSPRGIRRSPGGSLTMGRLRAQLHLGI